MRACNIARLISVIEQEPQELPPEMTGTLEQKALDLVLSPSVPLPVASTCAILTMVPCACVLVV